MGFIYIVFNNNNFVGLYSDLFYAHTKIYQEMLKQLNFAHNKYIANINHFVGIYKIIKTTVNNDLVLDQIFLNLPDILTNYEKNKANYPLKNIYECYHRIINRKSQINKNSNNNNKFTIPKKFTFMDDEESYTQDDNFPFVRDPIIKNPKNKNQQIKSQTQQTESLTQKKGSLSGETYKQIFEKKDVKELSKENVKELLKKDGKKLPKEDVKQLQKNVEKEQKSKQELEKLVKQLAEKKKKMKNCYRKKNFDFKKEETIFSKDREMIERERIELKKDQEKWDLFKRKFISDRETYLKMKMQINNKELDEKNIPLMFKEVYPVFKELDRQNILRADDVLNHYIKLMPRNNKNNWSFIPNNEEIKSIFQGDNIMTSGMKDNNTKIESDSSDLDDELEISDK